MHTCTGTRICLVTLGGQMCRQDNQGLSSHNGCLGNCVCFPVHQSSPAQHSQIHQQIPQGSPIHPGALFCSIFDYCCYYCRCYYCRCSMSSSFLFLSFFPPTHSSITAQAQPANIAVACTPSLRIPCAPVQAVYKPEACRWQAHRAILQTSFSIQRP